MNMTTKIIRLSAQSSTEQICAALESDAALIIENAIPIKLLREIRTELSPYLQSGETGADNFTGFKTKRIGALIARSPACRKLALDRRINNTAKKYLTPHANGYQLHFTQAVNIGPGEKAQPLHRDRGLWGGKIPRRIETQLSTIWAISDFTSKNGATQIVPGSHLWDATREPQEHEIVRAEMKAGSLLIYSGTVIHGGGANTTEQDHRLGVLIHYTLDWLRQEENQYLSCPPEIAKTLDPELQRLIGYSKGGPVLGFYSTPGAPGEGYELADPSKALD